MTLVRKIDGTWQAMRGIVELEKMVATRTVTYADGRQEEEDCAPYPVAVTLDMGKVERLIAEGVWSDEELATYGLRPAEPFAVPDGKQATGDARYVEKKGVVSEVYDVEDVPPPPAPKSLAEKLASVLTIEEFDEIVAASVGRLKEKS